MILRKPVCHYCGSRATTKDHRIPVSKGGDQDAENLVPACEACNNLKGDKMPGEFLDFMRKILVDRSPCFERHFGKARAVLSRLAPEMLP